MKPQELQIGDLIMAPFYGQKVPCKVVGITKEQIMYEALRPGAHRPGPYVSNGNNLEPMTLCISYLAAAGWAVKNGPDLMAYIHTEGPVPIRMEWNEENQALYIDDALFPTPIGNVHQMQKILRLLGQPETFAI